MELPRTGYYADVDVCGNEPNNTEIVQAFRGEAREAGLHVTVLELNGPSGFPFVRIRGNGRTKLRQLLDALGHADAEIIDARNTNAVARRR